MPQIINIIGGGHLGDRNFFQKKIASLEDCLIICCDGGVRHLQQTGIKPDVIIGDMDSIDPAKLASYTEQGVKTIKYPANKDFTDTELALDYTLSLKPEAIYIWAALGGRLDHTLSNVFLLMKGRTASIKTYLIDEYGEAFIIDGSIEFSGAAGQTVSLIALSPQVKGITLRGFLYPLDDAILRMDESRGLSNIIKEDDAAVSMRSGNLLVIRYWQKDIFPEAV